MSDVEFAKELITRRRNCDAEFMHQVGIAYKTGNGIAQNDDEALKWFILAADKDHAEALNSLGYCYDHGECGVQVNLEKAAELYRRSAEMGCAFAQVNLGLMYLAGRFVKQDYIEARKCFAAANGQKYWYATQLIGDMIFEGKGTTCNIVFAQSWYKGALDNADYFKRVATNEDRAFLRTRIAEIDKLIAIAKRTEVFVCYAHEDKRYLDGLLLQLNPLKKINGIEVWYDKYIRAGNDWEKDIENHLKAAKVAVLLVSPHFLNSDYIIGTELPAIKLANESEGLTILWLFVDKCRYSAIGLNAKQAAMSLEKTLEAMTDAERNAVYLSVAEEIERLYEPKKD